jgi:hypothetical protein
MSDELNVTKEIMFLMAGGAIGLTSSLATALVIWHIHSIKQKRERLRQCGPHGEKRQSDNATSPKGTTEISAQDPTDTDSKNIGETGAPLGLESNDRVSEIIAIDGTNITLSDKRQKRVEELKAGMALMAYDNKMLTNTVAKIVEINSDVANRHIIINGDIKLTETNRVETDKGIQDALTVSVGDAILRQDNLYKEVKGIQLKYGKIKLYTIKLEKRCGIFAEKYCVVDLD